ncbi:hypothetical protein [Elizabethkingia anophelis]|uniref:hypothetical protein n=1 Tax=Elizabethkingia anophelis TaxID=1117645 RepID=UPI003891627F
MKKHLFYPALWGILILSIFYSCRTDSVATEQTQQVNDKIVAFERFEKANNIIQPKASSKNNASSEKYVSYAAPFSEVITNFLETHSEYRERLEKEIGKIRLDVSSTTFGEGAKGVLFPVTDKNGKVIGAWGGIVNEERDYVKFYYLNNSSQEVASIKNAFQSYYDRNTGKLASLATASINPIAKKATEIEEVVITVYKPLTYYDLPWWWHDTGWTDPTKNPGPGPGTTMEGGPGTHGGGTNGTDNSNEQQDRCSQAKASTDKATEYSKTSAFQKSKQGVQDSYANNGKKGEFGTVFGIENGKFESTPVQTGNSNGHSASLTFNFSDPVADLHNHPGFNPPSMGDFYNMMRVNNTYGNFKTRYVITDDGTMYALIITNPDAMNKFKQNYPPVITPDPTGGNYTTFPQKILDEWNDLRMTFSDSGALAFVLDKYNSGIVLAKMDSAGNFRKINVTESKNADGSANYKYELCP